MEHLDPEIAALAALGENFAESAAFDHISQCESCQREVAALRSTVSVARSSLGEAQLVAAPARVWQAVHAQLGLSPLVAATPAMATTPAMAPTPAMTLTPATTLPPTTVAPMTPATPATHAVPAAPEAPAAPIVQLDAFRERRSGIRRFVMPVAASAAAAAIVAGGVLWWGATEPRDANQLIASAQLAALPDWQGASGQATVEQRPDGERIVQVSLDATLSDDVVREVWLLTENVDGLISLGWLTGSQGEFVVPASVDLTQYSVVDISAEPLDGDPTHSGDSIVRGALDV